MLKAPSALELEIADQLTIEPIRKVPVQGQPAAILSALEEIQGLDTTAKGIVTRFPSFPHQNSDKLVPKRINFMKQHSLKNLENQPLNRVFERKSH